MPRDSSCKACGAALLWTVTEAGKKMPLDMVPTTFPAGKIVVCYVGPVAHSRVVTERPEDGTCYVPHFATCIRRRPR